MRIERDLIGLCVIDVQEKLFPKIEGHEEIIKEMERAIRAFQILDRPIVATEQYPKGLGHTVPLLKSLLTTFQEKTVFSAYGEIRKKEPHVRQWVLVGIEAHVCVLQSALDLVEGGCQVIVPREAIGSRKRSHAAIASDEMRHSGVRITTLESVLFELLGDAKAPEFKEISALIK